MPRNYQRTKNNPYLLPHNLYMRTLYVIRDYDRRKDEYIALAYVSPHQMNGAPGSGRPSNPTENRGIRRAALFDELEAVEQALMAIPDEYRQGVRQNVMYGAWYPKNADVRTYQRWKQRFVYLVAGRLGFI